MRERAAVIILRDNAILLMYRRKLGQEYYIVPGGTVDEGETVEEAAIREAKEETGYDVVIEKQLFTEDAADGTHYYFLVHPVSGEALLGGQEKIISSEANFFSLSWVPFESLPEATIVSEKAKELLLSLPEIQAVIAAKNSS